MLERESELLESSRTESRSAVFERAVPGWARWALMLRVFLLSVVAAVAAAEDTAVGTGFVSDDVCASIATPSDTSYWDAITSCGPCVRKGCGYCLSTLQCQGGDERGPRAGAMPCPSWVWEDEGGCPAIPECGTLLSCGECATHEMCAWCAADQKCMTIEETFYKDCRGVVFDAPCPASHTPGAFRARTCCFA